MRNHRPAHTHCPWPRNEQELRVVFILKFKMLLCVILWRGNTWLETRDRTEALGAEMVLQTHEDSERDRKEWSQRTQGPRHLSDSSSWSHSLVQLSHCFFLSLLFLSKRWSLQSPPSRWETWGRRVTASVASMDWSKEITAGTGRRNKRENACSQIPRASLWEEQESNRCACRRVCKRVFLRI